MDLTPFQNVHWLPEHTLKPHVIYASSLGSGSSVGAANPFLFQMWYNCQLNIIEYIHQMFRYSLRISLVSDTTGHVKVKETFELNDRLKTGLNCTQGEPHVVFHDLIRQKSCS